MITTKIRQLSDGEELVLVEELGSFNRLQSDLREAAFDRRGRAIEGGRDEQRERRRRISDREEV